jgi:hypothetical protein
VPHSIPALASVSVRACCLSPNCTPFNHTRLRLPIQLGEHERTRTNTEKHEQAGGDMHTHGQTRTDAMDMRTHGQHACEPTQTRVNTRQHETNTHDTQHTQTTRRSHTRTTCTCTARRRRGTHCRISYTYMNMCTHAWTCDQIRMRTCLCLKQCSWTLRMQYVYVYA